MPEVKPQNRDFIRVGKSPIEGIGVFAKRKIPRGTRIIEYLGEIVPLNALYHVIDPGSPSRIYGFALNGTTAIDGARHGNEARFFNHSCEPNCEPYNFDGHIYIYAMRDISSGEELTFDYRLGPAKADVRSSVADSHYRCTCGAPSCRGTLLAPATLDAHKALGEIR